MKKINNSEFNLYACLPFLNILGIGPIHVGPIHFWPASHVDQFLDPALHGSYRSYLNSVCCLKNVTNQPDIPLSSLRIDSMTIVTIDPTIPPNDHENLFLDALHTLYFSAFFHHFLDNSKPPPIDPLGQFFFLNPASLHSFNPEKSPRVDCKVLDRILKIESAPFQLIYAFGMALHRAYGTDISDSNRFEAQKIIRSIRLFLNGQFDHSGCIGSTGHPFSDQPEGILFFYMAFDCLAELEDQHSASKLKQEIRAALNLRFAQPIETMWKWVDGFIQLRDWALYASGHPDLIFRGNSSLPIPILTYASKIFIYLLFYKLIKAGLVEGIVNEKMGVPQVPWASRPNIIAYLWEPEVLMNQLCRRISRIREDGANDPLYVFELEFWMLIYLEMDRELQLRGIQPPASLAAVCKELQGFKSGSVDLAGVDPEFLSLLDSVCKRLGTCFINS